MLNEFLNKQITVPMYRYEQLIENETRYNQLFKWQHEHGNDEILKTIDDEKLKDLLDQQEPTTCSADEETAATEEVVEVFHLGQKVKLIELGKYTNGFDIGEIVTIENLDYDDTEEHIKISHEGSGTGYVSEKQIKAINEKEGK